MGVNAEGEAPLVMLHGFMGSPDDWDEVIPHLQASRRPLCPCLPGHGSNIGLPGAQYTYGGCVTWVADQLHGVGRCDLAGYSMGGRIALGVALAFPERIRRLVLISASAGLEDADDRGSRLAIDRDRAARLRSGPIEEFLRDWYRQPLFAPLAEDGKRLEALIRRRGRHRGDELARVVEGMSPGIQPSLWDRLGELSMPVAALAGERDAAYVDVAERMAHLCPRGRAVIVPGAGHSLHVEAPAALARTLIAFLGATERELEIDVDH